MDDPGYSFDLVFVTLTISYSTQGVHVDVESPSYEAP